GFVPDFTFEAIPDVAFGPRAWSELSQGSFTLTTRRAIWPPFSWGPPGQFMARLLPRQASRGRIRRHTHNPVFRPKRLRFGLRWLDCELSWPNRLRISRLDELRMARGQGLLY